MQEQVHGFQLSPQQRRLWSLQHDSNAYQAQCAILLEGNLKLDILKSALQQVVNRHEILRTAFLRPRGIKISIQVIADSNLIEIEQHILANGQDLEQKIERLFQLQRQRISNWKGLSASNFSKCVAKPARFTGELTSFMCGYSCFEEFSS